MQACNRSSGDAFLSLFQPAALVDTQGLLLLDTAAVYAWLGCLPERRAGGGGREAFRAAALGGEEGVASVAHTDSEWARELEKLAGLEEGEALGGERELGHLQQDVVDASPAEEAHVA